MSFKDGLICQFVKSNWKIIADSSPLYQPGFTAQSLLTCDVGSFHSTDVQNSYVSFYFSKTILINSYLV